MKGRLKRFYDNYKHGGLVLLYGIIYLAWFRYLELNVTSQFQVIHMAWDDLIPFCELFVIPYFLWFFYVAAVVVFFLFKNKEDYYKTCLFLFTGMTLFLIISTLWPNGHHLRPAVMPRDNIFTAMVAMLYRTDTPTNLWPSIHVYNSIGAHLAIVCSKEFKDKRAIRIGSFILSCSIIASTVLIKQHSLFDVLTAFGLAAIMYIAVYRYDVIANAKMFLKKNTRPQIS
ncbi:MAG: serine/threonine protein phosphatase [Lachnoclostridium sp.]|nr:serine/threonine protein phosphatase [Lachnospira sp.]MCM1247968.1 serine/threonine protein phosphatase [Lachnoclostridium sp.]